MAGRTAQPERINASSGVPLKWPPQTGSDRHWCGYARTLVPPAALSALLSTTCAASAQTLGLPPADGLLTPLMAFAVGALASAVVAGGAWVLRSRRAADRDVSAARALARARADHHALRGLLSADAEGAVCWLAGADAPQFMGSAVILDAQAAGSPLDLAPWLGADAGGALAASLSALERDGTPFRAVVTGSAGGALDVEGRASAGSRVLLARPRASAPSGSMVCGDTLALLFAASTVPMWMRDAAGGLAAVNPAFAALVGAAEPADVIARGLELLDQAARDASATERRQGRTYQARVRVVAGGRRCLLDVVEAEGPAGVCGLAVDVTEQESLRGEIERTITAHRRTLDQLATAVVMFGADERLMFHNSAYETLFGLDAAFLDQRPTESEILERLRTARKVPEQANFRAWRDQLREVYRAIEPVHDWWHLPGGQMLRVVATPSAEGGVTYLFEDVSEHMALEGRYNALIRIQGETLDGLAEAVAVFGSDGRLNLYNHAFLSLWSLSAQTLGNKPHIDAVAAMCRPLHGETGAWARIRTVVTAIEQRNGDMLRLERADGRVLDGAAQPLPDGGTMVTFRDITDSVKVERALIERNEALEAADMLKNAFVGHVSYHLRTPLNTLIGYAHMLGEPTIGPLNARQGEFLDHVRQSSDTLRALIDDILDLATIDAGTMALDLQDLQVSETLGAVSEAVRDLLAEAGVSLTIAAAEETGAFVADGRRVRQILFNLLSNAIASSPRGGTVVLSAIRESDALVLKVQDQGPGIPEDMADALFERFEARASGGNRSGVGLGLSIVRSFMELHGGTITLANAEGGGAVAICVFPLSASRRNEAAA